MKTHSRQPRSQGPQAASAWISSVVSGEGLGLISQKRLVHVLIGCFMIHTVTSFLSNAESRLREGGAGTSAVLPSLYPSVQNSV